VAWDLLRLLTFFNPDGISINFLESASAAMADELRHLILDGFAFSQALENLETLGLVKWDRSRHCLFVDRVLQKIVRDAMSSEKSTFYRTMTNEICYQSFPQNWPQSFEDRARCRVSVDQIIVPLLDPDLLESDISADTLYFVGWFLRDDSGRLTDSEALLSRCCNIHERLFGRDDHATLVVKHSLAMTLKFQGKLEESVVLEEEVLESRADTLGPDAPETLTAMYNLASAYWAQGNTTVAARLQEEVWKKRVELFGMTDPDTLRSQSGVALTY
jgi:Tetratricopeptide repeat